MTQYYLEFKMPAEKTYALAIGEERHAQITAIQDLMQKRFGFKVTARAVVERAIDALHDTFLPKPEGDPKP